MMTNKEKEDFMKRALILLMVVVLGLGVFGCAGMKPAPDKMAPVKVSLDTVERLNATAAKPPYQATDVIVYKINFKLFNPNNVVAKVDNLYFEAKIDDGTKEKMIVLAGSMPSMLVPAGGEATWSYADPLLYGGFTGQIATRGLGGAEGMKGVLRIREELWNELGADTKKFFIDGNLITSLPDYPSLGTVYQQFKAEFAIPKL